MLLARFLAERLLCGGLDSEGCSACSQSAEAPVWLGLHFP